MVAEIEIWRPIPSFPGFSASSLGRIRRDVPERMPNGGYRPLKEPRRGIFNAKEGRYRLSIAGKTCRVGPLVCEAFHGPRPFPGAQAMHLNEISSDDRADNLRWGTRRENMSAPGFIAYCRSRPCGRRRLTDTHIAEIVAARASTSRDLAERYGISIGYVQQIWKRRGRPG